MRKHKQSDHISFPRQPIDKLREMVGKGVFNAKAKVASLTVLIKGRGINYSESAL